jgi:hypothetical protein
LLLSIVWLTACGVGDRSSPVFTTAPLAKTPFSPPTRSVGQASTLALEETPTVVPLIARPIETAHSIASAPTLAAVTRSQPTATPALPECPPLPAPAEVKTRAAVQHFEHGIMFWLQDRDEIWSLIASPLENQFTWRVLPDAWSDGVPESDPTLQPPAGRYQPVRGFGYAWRYDGGSYEPQRADLGWAIDEEAGFDAVLVYYPQGSYSPECAWMPRSGIYELTGERGTAYQFVGAGGIARVVRP